ncbi:hypothetical protein ARMA_0656 [Ardenticatena maritima]|uniref:Uncharacterized protein n=1 Tax=Ardenticatena maritima TaxID=872965 RepID=A0A0M8K5M8_9CHLR|nr:hypothetical protein ARMA_0656 [Ardenticatena maritima]
MQVWQVLFLHGAQVVVLQVVQAQGAALFFPAGQGAVHKGLGQVEHIVFIQVAGFPEGGQHVQGDGLILGEDGQVQVAVVRPFWQRRHAHFQGRQQGGVFVAGEKAAEFLQVSLAQAAQGAFPTFGILAHEGAHHGHGQRQVAAFRGHFAGGGGQVFHLLPGPGGQQGQGLFFGQHVQGEGLRLQGLQDLRVAGGEQETRSHPFQVQREGFRVGQFPNIVQDDQAGLLLQGGGQEETPLGGVFEVFAFACQDQVKVLLAGGEFRLAPHLQPDDAVGEGGLHLQVARQGGGQHALADAAHALHADDAQRGGVAAQQGFPQGGQKFLTRDVVVGQGRHVVDGRGQQALQVRAAVGVQPHDVVVAGHDDRAVRAAADVHSALTSGDTQMAGAECLAQDIEVVR